MEMETAVGGGHSHVTAAEEREMQTTTDEVDCAFAPSYVNNYDSNNVDNETNLPKNQLQQQQQTQQLPSLPNTKNIKKKFISSAVDDVDNTSTEQKQQQKQQKKTTTKERLSLFSFGKKNSQKSLINKCSHSKGKEKGNKEDNTTNASKEKIDLETSPTTDSSLTTYQPPPVRIGTPPRQHKFVKSSSIARLLGNTYNAKKFEKEEQKHRANEGKFNTYSGGRRRASGPYLERFKLNSKENGNGTERDGSISYTGSTVGSCADIVKMSTDSRELFGGSRSDLIGIDDHGLRAEDLGAKAFRTISRGLGKLWWRRSHSVDISTPDPEFKVSYLGNVLTGWAKGEGCVEKQLNTLWRNYTQNNKPDVIMRIKVCASGLKATTRQHGLTEYWANRITYCCAPANYPRVFCWIYRHEGRKLKHELRCHAVLCSKEKMVHDICDTLKANLESALREFKRDKLLKQNARLSLANAAYDNPSLPRRKIMLSVGGNNYRPPLERSKSAPKLMAIEEAIGEEEGDEIEETNEPEMKSCCQKDSLYPAMTLGRRRCRKGHSIRRTGKGHEVLLEEMKKCAATACCNATKDRKTPVKVVCAALQTEEEQRHSYASDDSDDFEKLLKYNNYDSSASLANELLPYFDIQLNKTTSCSLDRLSDHAQEEEPLSLLPTINSDPNAHPNAEFELNLNADADTEVNHDENHELVGLRRDGICSDGEEDYLEDDMYFRRAAILDMLHRNSMRKMAQLSLSSDEGSLETNASLPLQCRHQIQSSISSNGSSVATSASSQENMKGGALNTQRNKLSVDSDEGSISSGCETASTATANQDDLSLKYRHGETQNMASQMQTCDEEIQQLRDNGLNLEEEPITAEEIYQRLESRLQKRHNSDATTFSSSSSITLKMGNSPTASLNGLDATGNSNNNPAGVDNSSTGSGGNNTTSNTARITRRVRRQSQRPQAGVDSDSECSDESGYVEDQERGVENKIKNTSTQQMNKPQPPPKPTPRRLINIANAATVV